MSHHYIKGELRPEISLLHMEVLTLIKGKSNVFLWYVQCCSCTLRSKTKILTTRAPPSWIQFDAVTSQRQTQSASDCVKGPFTQAIFVTGGGNVTLHIRACYIYGLGAQNRVVTWCYIYGLFTWVYICARICNTPVCVTSRYHPVVETGW